VKEKNLLNFSVKCGDFTIMQPTIG